MLAEVDEDLLAVRAQYFDHPRRLRSDRDAVRSAIRSLLGAVHVIRVSVMTEVVSALVY